MVKSVHFVMQNLEARPAALLVQAASRYKSDIRLSAANRVANAKSLMGVMSLGILEGRDIIVMALGPDEEDAHNAVKAVLEQSERNDNEDTLP